MPMTDKIVGIDFGTSTSEVAVLNQEKPLVIANHLGEHITPSAVSFSESGEMIIGKDARDQLLLQPEDTVIEVKRLMGSDETVLMQGKKYSPQQVASFILSYLMDCARNHLGNNVSKAVITVPAYFSDVQRRAVMEAGKLAGITVERIINEPTAAALDYGIEHMQECQHLLVYDLGGGTLDVTVLEMFEGILEVKASAGNNKLGGKDFDQRLIDYLLKRFAASHKLEPSAVTKDKRALVRLKEEAEKCKIALSEAEEYHLLLTHFAKVKNNPAALEDTITREIFEGLIKDLIDTTAAPIQSALDDAGLKAADLDLVLLVGGSTRMPYVQQFIEQTLGQKPGSLIDPDLAVVRGAAIQGGIINGELSAGTDILITDVCPYTLGISVLDVVGGLPVPDAFDTIIPRNVTIPTVKKKIYGTVVDDQTMVEIKAYQGEFKKASHNNFLGRFMLEGIPPAPAFKEKVSVSFAYDANGILQVEGTVLSSGEKANLVIETNSAEMEEEVDFSTWDQVPQARKYKAILKKAAELIESGKAGIYAFEMESLVQKIKAGLVRGEKAKTLNQYKKELHEIVYELTEDEDD